ncbi:hypothetical protein [Chromobacterium violaceum]|uniref:hypothetical protein n=1 Tax=Chromobacterium violaceum TaxID=536 RepID=UPI00111C2017|nr:hypothetical protein [Chromobacterium violaceum]
MDTFKKILQISLKKLHTDLNISQDFIIGIHDENNSWNFISKFAQFIEGLFTKVLVLRLNEEATYNTISNLPQSVRLSLAFDLNLITKEQKFLFLTIAEIRNDYIHKISNVEVNLSDYLKTLKADRIKEIYKRFKPFILDEKITSHEEFIEDCVNAIFAACALEISRVHGEVEGYAAERKHAEFRTKQAERLLPKQADDAMFLTDMGMVHNYVREARETLKKAGLFKLQFPPEQLP